MNKWQRKCITSALILLFIGPLFGLLQPTLTNPPLTTTLPSGTIHSTFTVYYTSDVNDLSNTTLSDDLAIDPEYGNITGAIISNFTLAGGYQCIIQNTSNNKVELSVINSIFNTNLDNGFNLKGSPSITGTNIFISGPLQSNSYPAQIGTPTLNLNNVNASKIQFHVSGGTFIWNHSQTTSLILNGFTTTILGSNKITGALTVISSGTTTIQHSQTASLTLNSLTGFSNTLLDSDTITGDLTVLGDGIVTILHTQINGIINETGKPTISCPTTHYVVPYAYVFQPKVSVDLNWGASDNIRGDGFDLSYNLTIFKSGQLLPVVSIPPTAPGPITHTLSIDTAATYEIHLVCEDGQGNVSSETLITILPQPNLLWFILMIVIIVAATVGAIVIFFMWKQRQWQKTALVEIPA